MKLKNPEIIKLRNTLADRYGSEDRNYLKDDYNSLKKLNEKIYDYIKNKEIALSIQLYLILNKTIEEICKQIESD